jgi:flagellar biosynthetic protein FlhB
VSGSDKTEAPTRKKRREARREGRVAKSADLVTWSVVLAGSMVIPWSIGTTGNRVAAMLAQVHVMAADPETSRTGPILHTALIDIALAVAPLAAVTILVAIAVTGMQTGLIPATKNLKPSFKRINPMSGFKRSFGPHALWEGGKALVKSIVVGIVVYQALRHVVDTLVGADGLAFPVVIGAVQRAIFGLLRSVAFVGLLLGFVDYAWQKKRTEKELKMTKHEVREEGKQNEGNPQMKGAIRSRQMALSRNRMMAAVAESDVVIVNPTHVAVALRYDPARGAPRVMAKGSGALATKIRERATEARIPMVEDIPLARALHRACDVGMEIPAELYAAVARVLAFVLSLRRRGPAAGIHRVPGSTKPVPAVERAARRKRLRSRERRSNGQVPGRHPSPGNGSVSSATRG